MPSPSSPGPLNLLTGLPLRRLFDPSRITPSGTLLVVLWTAQLWTLQEMTLECSLWEGEWQLWLDRGIRLTLDVLTCTLLVTTLPKRLLGFAVVLSGFATAVLVAYFQYFEKPLSVFTIIYQFHEGVQVAEAGVSQFKSWHFLALFFVVAQLYLVWSLPRFRNGNTVGTNWKRALALTVLYAAVVLGANVGRKQMWKIATWESVAGIGYIYGYVPTWISELAFVRQEAVLEKAIKRGKEPSDRLAGIESDIALGPRTVVIQVESLDWDLLDMDIGGKAVTPNLRRMAEKGFVVAVKAPKVTGSCDSDFTMLMGRLPSDEIPTYRIRDYPFENSFPAELSKLGVESWAVHGVSGSFFGRRGPFNRMGIHNVVFREDFAADTDYDASDWTVSDGDLLDFVGNQIDESKSQFVFSITASSHIPFRFLQESDKKFFPGSNAPNELYFDSMHYVDAHLGRLAERLPPGTAVAIYGDHTSKMKNEALGYEPTVIDGVGVVPFIVYDPHRNLAVNQRTRGESVATSGELSLLDATTFLHRSIRKSHGRLATL